MNKVFDFIKKKYKVLVPIMVVFVLLIAIYFLYREYRYDNYREKQEVAVYQYFGGTKKEYTAIITYNLKKVIVDIQGKDKKINYGSTPVYYQDEQTILFPREMTIVFPLKGGASSRLYQYTTYELVNGVHKIVSGRKSQTSRNFFLFDGKELYFFADEVTLKVDGEEYVTLGANSYAKVVGGYTLTYYDKATDKSEVLEIEGKEVTAVNDHVIVNLTDKSFNVYGKKVLLNDPSILNPLLNNWQIKEGNDIIKFRIDVL